MSQTMVSRVWRAFGLQPHRQETFKLSSDLAFVDKVRDVVGLYIEPARPGSGAVRRREVSELDPKLSRHYQRVAGCSRCSLRKRPKSTELLC
jgi:hypothetical protein